MYLESTCRAVAGMEIEASAYKGWAFVSGRGASVRIGEKELAQVGELSPDVIHAFGLGVPVSGFELDLSLLYEQLK